MPKYWHFKIKNDIVLQNNDKRYSVGRIKNHHYDTVPADTVCRAT